MNVNYINPFLLATRDVFKTMIQLPITLGKPYLRQDREPKYDVSAAIGISGAVVGSAVISFPIDVAVAVASGLAGTPMAELNQDAVDALGEVANMITGSAKSKLPVGGCKLSLPNVVLGRHRIAMPSHVPIIVIPCSVVIGGDEKNGMRQFIIEIAFREVPASAATDEAEAQVAKAG